MKYRSDRIEPPAMTGSSTDAPEPFQSATTAVRRIRPRQRASGQILRALGHIAERTQVEVALRDSEERYRSLFNSIDEGFCVIEMLFDRDGKPADYCFLEVNPAFEAQTGLHGVTGKRMRELVPDHEQHWFEAYGKVVLTGEPVRFVNEAKALGDRWFDVNAFRLGGPGSPKVAVLFTDITARQEAEQALRNSERRLREMVDALPAAIYTIDAEGRVTHFNPAAVEFSGRVPQIGADRWCVSWKLYRPDGTPLPHDECPMAVALRTGRDVRGAEAIVERPDGTRRCFKAYPTALRDAEGKLVGGINMLVDVTESKRAEEALRASDRHKDEFIAMLAHELRNPLAPLRNALEVLRRAAGSVSPDAPQGPSSVRGPGTRTAAAGNSVESAVDMMERQVGQMTRLVDDLLDVSRVSRGKIELRKQRVELSAVVDHVVQSVRPLCESMGHELAVAVPPAPVLLDADPTRLAQIAGNLLNNACKFTERGGRIGLTMELDDSAPLGTPHLVLRVQDSGIGIAADQLSRIFEMFTQVDASLDRSTGGLGIGLALVKSLAELHGGTVSVHSAGPGRGSEFVVRLPILAQGRESPLVAVAPAPVTMSAEPPLRILVVDDNRDSADSLALLLQLHGHETHAVYGGLEAVQAVATLRPDAVLLDIGLPGLDGCEAARRIREQEAGKKLVMVALTGWGQEEDRRRTAVAGFDAHMVKPVEPDTLMTLLAGRRLPRG